MCICFDFSPVSSTVLHSSPNVFACSVFYPDYCLYKSHRFQSRISKLYFSVCYFQVSRIVSALLFCFMELHSLVLPTELHFEPWQFWFLIALNNEHSDFKYLYPASSAHMLLLVFSVMEMYTCWWITLAVREAGGEVLPHTVGRISVTKECLTQFEMF